MTSRLRFGSYIFSRLFVDWLVENMIPVMATKRSCSMLLYSKQINKLKKKYITKHLIFISSHKNMTSGWEYGRRSSWMPLKGYLISRWWQFWIGDNRVNKLQIAFLLTGDTHLPPILSDSYWFNIYQLFILGMYSTTKPLHLHTYTIILTWYENNHGRVKLSYKWNRF